MIMFVKLHEIVGILHTETLRLFTIIKSHYSLFLYFMNMKRNWANVVQDITRYTVKRILETKHSYLNH